MEPVVAFAEAMPEVEDELEDHCERNQNRDAEEVSAAPCGNEGMKSLKEEGSRWKKRVVEESYLKSKVLPFRSRRLKSVVRTHPRTRYPALGIRSLGGIRKRPRVNS